MSEILISNLFVSYNDIVVLQDINICVQKGEFVSIVGLSGTGKTTLLNAIAGFIPGKGQVSISGQIGVVFQDYAVFHWMTVRENIAFGLDGISREQKIQIVDRNLELIQLRHLADKYPAELSGGQIQRVGLARALAPEPQIILMDEPYGALDRHTREKMQAWLLEVWSHHQKTVVFVTHDIEEAVFLSDRVAVLSNKTISECFLVPFPRPREEELKFSQDFIQLKKAILDSMRMTTLASFDGGKKYVNRN